VNPEQRMTVEAMARAWGQWQSEPGFPFTDDHCINGARVVTRALEKLGVQSRAVSVQFLLFNRPAWMLFEQDIPVSEWPPEAWSLGVGPNAQRGVANRWDGHVVVEGEGWTLDISAKQFARPGRIRVDGPRLMPPLPTNGQFMHLEDEWGQVLLIKPWPQNNGWRGAAGWRRLHGTEVKEIVKRTLRYMERGKEPTDGSTTGQRSEDRGPEDGPGGGPGTGERSATPDRAAEGREHRTDS
jgi:hypothetical protein